MREEIRAEFEFWLERCSKVNAPERRGILVYVAGPFSPYKDYTVDDNVGKACIAAMKLCLLGYDVFVPHKNSEWARDFHWRHKYWLGMDINILRRCDVLFLQKAWQVSAGAWQEFDTAGHIGIHIAYEPAQWTGLSFNPITNGEVAS